MIKKKKQGNDLRVLKTKKIIKETFMQLVEEKGYSRVTVSEITERALINRNTFYLHYYDKEDVVIKFGGIEKAKDYIVYHSGELISEVIDLFVLCLKESSNARLNKINYQKKVL